MLPPTHTYARLYTRPKCTPNGITLQVKVRVLDKCINRNQSQIIPMKDSAVLRKWQYQIRYESLQVSQLHHMCSFWEPLVHQEVVEGDVTATTGRPFLGRKISTKIHKSEVKKYWSWMRSHYKIFKQYYSDLSKISGHQRWFHQATQLWHSSEPFSLFFDIWLEEDIHFLGSFEDTSSSLNRRVKFWSTFKKEDNILVLQKHVHTSSHSKHCIINLPTPLYPGILGKLWGYQHFCLGH